MKGKFLTQKLKDCHLTPQHDYQMFQLIQQQNWVEKGTTFFEGEIGFKSYFVLGKKPSLLSFIHEKNPNPTTAKADLTACYQAIGKEADRE